MSASSNATSAPTAVRWDGRALKEEVRRAAVAMVAPSLEVPAIEPLDPDAVVPAPTSNPHGPNRIRSEGRLRRLLGR